MKHPLKLWKSDNPEPQDYNYHRDPLHEVDSNSCPDRRQLVSTLAQYLSRWIENPAFPFDSGIAKERKAWRSRGGNDQVFDEVQTEAFLASGYYKKMLKA